MRCVFLFVFFLFSSCLVFASIFSRGAFINTSDSQSESVFVSYDTSGGRTYGRDTLFKWFSGSQGTYFSAPIVFKPSEIYSLESANWSWFEAPGLYLDDALLASFSFENDSKDSGRLNFSGVTSFGNARYPSLNLSGVIGSSYSFNGSQSISVPEVILNSSNDFTWMAWVWLPENPVYTDYLTIYSAHVTNRTYFQLDKLSGGPCGAYRPLFQYTKRNDGLTASFCGFTRFNTSSWMHYALTMNSTHVTTFVNGVPESTNVTYGNYLARIPSPSSYIGSVTGSMRFFNGSIDEMHFFNRTLSANEVRQIYSWELSKGKGNQGFIQNFTNVSLAFRAKNYSFDKTGLLGWWDFGDSCDDENASGVSLDLSGRNNTAFLSNALVSSSCVLGKCISQPVGGKNYYANVSRLGSFNPSSSDWTFSAWFKNSGVGEKFLLANKFSSIDYLTIIVSGNQVFAQFYRGGFEYSCYSTGYVPGEWAHLVVSYNGSSSCTIYLNGVKGSPYSGASWESGVSGSFIIGGLGFGEKSIAGAIDDVKFWSRSLSEGEVLSLYNGGNPGGPGGKESLWSSWSQEYFFGNASVQGVAGNILQYRASFTSLGPNYSAFLKYVDLSYFLQESVLYLKNAFEDPSSPVLWTPTQSYEFTSSWFSYYPLSTVLLEFNGVNYSPTFREGVYSVVLQNLPIGDYSFKWFANDSSGNSYLSEERIYSVVSVLPGPSPSPGVYYLVTNCSPGFSTVSDYETVSAILYYNGVQQSCPGAISLTVSPTTVFSEKCVGNKAVYSINLPEGGKYTLLFKGGYASKTCVITKAEVKAPGGFPDLSIALIPLIAFASLLLLRRKKRGN